jgi:hypothetical protein
MIGLKRITPLNSEYRRRFIATISFVALTISFSATSAAAQSEDQIKAAFLFNFARYVEWPTGAFESSDATLRICMVGSGDFASVVSETVASKNVGDRAVEVDTSFDLFGASVSSSATGGASG